jgi:hypothetical protein
MGGWGLDYDELVGQWQAPADLDDETAAFGERQVKLATQYLRADRDRLERRLKETEQELGAAIRRGAELARRIDDLESSLEGARPRPSRADRRHGEVDGDAEVSPSLLVTLDPELWRASVAGIDPGDREGRAKPGLAKRRSTAGRPRP